jgi:hypothetical protein
LEQLAAMNLIAAIGNGEAFRKGDEFCRLVWDCPREHSIGASKSCWAQVGPDPTGTDRVLEALRFSNNK